MRRFFKILLWTVVALVVIFVGLMAGFVYKVKNGFPVSYETEIPAIDFPADKTKVLLFSKATGFRHGESIDAGKKVFTELAQENNWFLYETEAGGVFNTDQLQQFDAVIFNNSTGRVLNEQQQNVLEDYVEQGGNLIGIHGTGDDSHHHWPWYEQNFLGAKFSHHPLDPQLQSASINLVAQPDSLLALDLPATWTHTDEWYVFFENPVKNGFTILYAIDGTQIKPSGNMLWMTDKDFGMGKDHPVAWYRAQGKGRTFYTSIGHSAEAWTQAPFVTMLENAVLRAKF
jgi:type 1 glutamine amidotransferase